MIALTFSFYSFHPTKFVETLPNARLEWIEECGHVPHLEQPDLTADAIANFLASDVKSSSSSSTSFMGSVQGPQPTYFVGAGFFGALAISGALNLLSAH